MIIKSSSIPSSFVGGHQHMHNHFLHQFMKKENEKRNQSKKDSHCFQVNQTLNRFLKKEMHIHNLHHSNGGIKKVLQYTSRYISSCTIINLSYRNNFENLEVAVLQYLFLKTIMENFNQSTRSINYIENELRLIDSYKTVHLMERHRHFFKSLSFS